MDTMAISQEAVGKQSLDVESVEAARLLVDADEAPADVAKGRILCLGCILPFMNVVFLLLLAGLAWYLWAANSVCDCSEKALSTYSPIYDRLDITTSAQHFNNTFWPDGVSPSIYQRARSPEVDEAWARISDTHAFRLTHNEVVRMGKDPLTLWPWPRDGGESSAGPREYMGMVDFFHQAHCLENLGRAAFPAHYNVSATRAAFAGHPFPFDDHLLHCQYILLEALMCHADVEVVTYKKVAGVTSPFANFAVDRICRNFDAVLDWKERHSVVEVPRGWERFWTEVPEGIVELDPWDTKTPHSS